MGAKTTVGGKIWRIILLLCVVYLVVLIAITVIQRRMIYFPTKFGRTDAERWARGNQLEPWKNAAGQNIGWKRLSTKPAAGQVLVVHGNAGSALDRAGYAEELQTAEPLHVYILEYPGYGSRPGSPAQDTIFAAAGEAIDLLPSDLRLYVLGESLGTGVAAWLAGANPKKVAGLVLFAPYNNFTDVARQHLPLFPVGWMLFDRFPSENYLQTYHGPVAIFLAGKDTVVPGKFGRKLFYHYSGPKRLWEYPNATHDNLSTLKPPVWKEVISFWNGT